LVNRLNIEKTPVAVFADPLMAGLSGDALYTSWYNVAFNKEIASVQSEQDLANILLKRGVKFIILNSSWNGLNCCSGGLEKQDYIEKISLKIAEYGSISIRKIKSEYQLKLSCLAVQTLLQ